MTQLSLVHYGQLIETVDPFLHLIVISGVLLVLFEVAVLLGGVMDPRDTERGRRRSPPFRRRRVALVSLCEAETRTSSGFESAPAPRRAEESSRG